MIKKLFKKAVDSGWALAVGTLGATIGNAIYEVGSYVVHETILKNDEEEECEEDEDSENESENEENKN